MRRVFSSSIRENVPALELFDDFKKTKYRLDSREEANQLCTKFDDIKID